ncbi:MAG: ABC-F family ATP-binding cassette domain-containing protein, partial [Clostridia bacterium]|nr:ABC-F family ATP-binding cassette domain-containing protein [Clostridia bacterium]
KTTVLRLILGELIPDEGSVFRKSGIRIGYLAQTGGFQSDSTVYGAMKEVFREDEALISHLGNVQRELASAAPEKMNALSARIESLNKRIAARDSYNYEVRIKTVLGGMGFERVYNQNVDTMSGGERTKLKLCRLLLEEPDLLILDEPTNHLDLKTLFWLEEYLTSYKGAILVVSHDRYFLDRLTSRTLELEHRKLSSYKGNYSKYKILKAERYKEELRAYEKQQEEIAKLQTYVDKNIVRATTAKSALSRVNKLERMELFEPPTPPAKPPRFFFETEEKPYERVLEALHFDLKVDEKALLKDASIKVMRGEKCALVGDNGTGKSTLLKFLLSGDKKVAFGRLVKTAYYDQENADLDPEERTLDAFWGQHVGLSQTDARKILAQAGLFSEDIDKAVKELSGGMRAKLELAILEARKGNFLILDEPTNHLDLAARESLEEALIAFDGTLLFVSHDRRFIEQIATAIFAIEDGKLTYFKGSYAEYLSARKATSPPPMPAVKEKKTDGYRSKEERAREARARNRIREIELRLETVEAEEAELNEALITYASDYVKVREITARLATLQRESETLYDEYEKLI